MSTVNPPGPIEPKRDVGNVKIGTQNIQLTPEQLEKLKVTLAALTASLADPETSVEATEMVAATLQELIGYINDPEGMRRSAEKANRSQETRQVFVDNLHGVHKQVQVLRKVIVMTSDASRQTKEFSETIEKIDTALVTIELTLKLIVPSTVEEIREVAKKDKKLATKELGKTTEAEQLQAKDATKSNEKIDEVRASKVKDNLELNKSFFDSLVEEIKDKRKITEGEARMAMKKTIQDTPLFKGLVDKWESGKERITSNQQNLIKSKMGFF